MVPAQAVYISSRLNGAQPERCASSNLLPGLNRGRAIAASFMGYNVSKSCSKDTESPGKHSIEHVFVPETAAHTSGIAALPPMPARGIPTPERWRTCSA